MSSGSSSSFAAFVALLNDARIHAGNKPLGFLNPLIYSLNGKGFNDITDGNNPGCGTPGFNVSVSGSGKRLVLNIYDQATPGWDAVTGFGTPDFGKLKDIVMNASSWSNVLN